MLIVFEGIDGAGKTTQVDILLDKLRKQGEEVSFYQYPSKKERSKKIYDHLLEKTKLTADQLLTLYLDDIYYDQQELKNKTKDEIIILSRYIFSTIAYQGIKLGMEYIIKEVEKRNFLKPDIVFLLDIPAEEGLRRKKGGEHIFEKDLEFQEKVRQNLLNLYKSHYFASHWVFLDGERAVKDIYKVIEQNIKIYK
ncbi:dTMP kinase [Candidatus Woesearchaeota archaeon]|nr:MAG: dTMP kinase [Candidatus Woesearchaeota archaeon]